MARAMLSAGSSVSCQKPCSPPWKSSCKQSRARCVGAGRLNDALAIQLPSIMCALCRCRPLERRRASHRRDLPAIPRPCRGGRAHAAAGGPPRGAATAVGHATREPSVGTFRRHAARPPCETARRLHAPGPVPVAAEPAVHRRGSDSGRRAPRGAAAAAAAAHVNVHRRQTWPLPWLGCVPACLALLARFVPRNVDVHC